MNFIDNCHKFETIHESLLNIPYFFPIEYSIKNIAWDDFKIIRESSEAVLV